MKSLANIFRHLLHTNPHQNKSHSVQDRPEEEHYELLAQGTQHPAAPSPPTPPSRQEVLNYLGQLADDYHLPRRFVYAIAEAESSLDPTKPPHPNYEMSHGRIVHDKNGNRKVKSWDYGLMQVNSSNIAHVDSHGRQRGLVHDAHGHPFLIAQDVVTDWRANARAAVALLAPAYRLAELEQGPGATPEDHAQQAYSQYNTGTPRMRERYLRQRRDGTPQNGADRNFLNAYHDWRQ